MSALGDLAGMLGKHRLSLRGGVHICGCGRDIARKALNFEDRKAARDVHDLHVAQVLIAEGVTLAQRDPRERFLQRANRQQQGDTPPAS